MEETPTPRRSGRQRKSISYKDFGDALSRDSSPDTPPFIANDSELDEEPDSEPDLDADADDGSVPAKRPRRAAVHRAVADSADTSKAPMSKVSKEGRFAFLAGNDEQLREVLETRFKNWKNLLTEVPQELLDYTIGWGTCSGEWEGKGGQRQKVEILDARNSPGIFKPVEKTFKLSVGPKSKRETIESHPFKTHQLSSFLPKRRGHLINVGYPIWALDFLPQPPKSSQIQYIAVSGHPTPDPRPSLYTPAPAPNTIQIWAIESHSSKAEGKTYLAMTITHSWGSCWGLKFCPYGAYGDGRVGLLAGVFGDRVARVIDVRQEWLGSGKGPVNVLVSSAGWEYSLGEGCLATCVCWNSHTEIVVGCSNGFVAAFDLSDDTETYGIPSFYSLVSDTYIVAITSLAPSNPHLIGLTSFDGQVTSFDLRSPDSDSYPLLRQRGIPPAITPLPFWKGILCPDEVCGVRYSSLRLFRRGTMLSVHKAAIWDVAASQGGEGAGVHGLVLSVASDGGTSRQILFRLEKEKDGTLKFTEDYTVDTPDLHKVSGSKEFDPEVAVTKVVWCMNAGYESWYATGLRCGLVRIEDLNFHR